MNDVQPEPAAPDLQPYAGRWVALVRGQVAGVGATADEARHAAKHQRPKEEPTVVFVPSSSGSGVKPSGGEAS